MEKKINVAELLKDCPSGVELDCASYDNVSFDKISDDKKATYPIFCYITDKEGNRSSISFTENGCESKRYGAKCVIFPKGKTTWEGFVPPCKFNDGAVLVHTQNQRFIMSIYHKRITEFIIKTHCILWDKDEGLSINMNICCYPDNTRLATEEEKQKLFDVIKANGYKWNAETKTLEKLLSFKVGDRIKKKGDYISGIITQIDIENFYKVEYCGGGVSYINSEYQDDYELVRNKFDINNLVPFKSRVLVRGADGDLWKPAIYGFSHPKGCYVVGGVYWRQCIPYEGNEHLLGATNDCDEFF